MIGDATIEKSFLAYVVCILSKCKICWELLLQTSKKFENNYVKIAIHKRKIILPVLQQKTLVVILITYAVKRENFY